MILHISCDDQFVRYVDKQFMEGKTSSKLVVCDYKKSPVLAKQAPHMQYIQVYTEEFRQLLQSLGQYNGIIFHGLYGRWVADVLDAVPEGVTIAWVIWDGEIFGRPEIESSFYRPLTKCMWRIKKLYSYIRNGCKRRTPYFVPVDKFSKIKFCLCDMPQESAFASKYLQRSLEWMPYNYYSVKETICNLYDERATGPNVFLGNSCTYNNNHIDALWRLKSLVTTRQKVVTPLSYGDFGLRKHIVRVGKMLLGQSFNPLVDYLSLEEYNAQMLSCSIMIQYLGSPGAQGNIVTGLWLGMRVYLNKQSIMYKFFKSIGAYVYSVEDDLNKNNPYLFQPMNDEEMAHNRRIIENYFGEKTTSERVENIISRLDKNKSE